MNSNKISGIEALPLDNKSNPTHQSITTDIDLVELNNKTVFTIVKKYNRTILCVFEPSNNVNDQPVTVESIKSGFAVLTVKINNSSILYGYQQTINNFFSAGNINVAKFKSMVDDGNFVSNIKYFIDPNDSDLDDHLFYLQEQIKPKIPRIMNKNETNTVIVFGYIRKLENNTSLIMPTPLIKACAYFYNNMKDAGASFINPEKNLAISNYCTVTKIGKYSGWMFSDVWILHVVLASDYRIYNYNFDLKKCNDNTQNVKFFLMKDYGNNRWKSAPFFVDNYDKDTPFKENDNITIVLDLINLKFGYQCNGGVIKYKPNYSKYSKKPKIERSKNVSYRLSLGLYSPGDTVSIEGIQYINPTLDR